ncbi:MAG: sugar transferase, partial [Anaerolineaceae bacterium]
MVSICRTCRILVVDERDLTDHVESDHALNAEVRIMRSTYRQTMIKRYMDLTLSLLTLLLLFPLILVICLLIKLDSAGSVLFSQPRIGKDGKPFIMFKFRTMYQHADDQIHQDHVAHLIASNKSLDESESDKRIASSLKLHGDPRITHVGRILRRFSLDELPQIINVLRGEMSLVGPRPPIQYEVDLYEPWHWQRFLGNPGITGPWQVYGRNRVSFDDMVKIDIEYFRNWSILLDIKIILLT